MSMQRTVTSLVMAPVAIVAVLFLPTPWLAALVAVICLLGLWEWALLAGLDDVVPRSIYVAANLTLMAALPWSDVNRSHVLFRIGALVGAFWWVVAVCWLARPAFGRQASRWFRSLKLAAGTLCIIPAWCGLVVLHFGQQSGRRWALLAILMVWVADSCAYLFGTRYGRRKLIPQISPGKTWAGLWGGLLCAMAVTLACAPLVGVTLARLPLLAVLGLSGVMASVVGDLFESLMKRHAGVKDSGTLIPGHGGVLDRIDGLMAALPVIAIGKEWLGL
jgi:phosphatidate cytidylyltransferase